MVSRKGIKINKVLISIVLSSIIALMNVARAEIPGIYVEEVKLLGDQMVIKSLVDHDPPKNDGSLKIKDCAENIVRSAGLDQSNPTMQDIVTYMTSDGSISNILNCVNAASAESQPTKAMYLIFGTVMSDAVVNISTIIDTQNYNIMEAFSEGSAGLETRTMGIIFTAFSTIIMLVMCGLLMAQAFYLLLLSSGDSGLRETGGIAKTLMKSGVGVFLIVPVFYGFSLAQILILLTAYLATVMANLIWFLSSILLTVIFIFNLEPVVDTDFVENYLAPSIANSMVEINQCALTKRNYALESQFGESVPKQSELMESKFFKCMDSNFRSPKYSSDLLPSEVRKIEGCYYDSFAPVGTDIMREDISCGLITTKNGVLFNGGQQYIDRLNQRAAIIAGHTMAIPCTTTDQTRMRITGSSGGATCIDMRNGFDLVFSGDELQYFPSDLISTGSLYNKIKVEYDLLVDDIVKTISLYTQARAAAYAVEHKTPIKILEVSLRNGWFDAANFLNASSKRIAASKTEAINSIDMINVASSYPDMLEISGLANLGGDSMTTKHYDDYTEEWISFKNQDPESSYTILNMFEGVFRIRQYMGLKDGNSLVEAISGPDACINNFNNCKTSSLSPLYGYMDMGASLTETMLPPFMILGGVQYFTKDVGRKTGSKLLRFFSLSTGLVLSVVKILFLVGLLMVYVTPLFPFFFFLAYIINWIVMVIEGVLTAQIWAMLHVTKMRADTMYGGTEVGYKLLFTIFLIPSVLVLAMVSSLFVSSIGIALVNILFGLVMSILPITENITSITVFVQNTIGYVIYAILLTFTIYKATDTIFRVPDYFIAKLNALSMPGSANDWAEVINRAKVVTTSSLSTILTLPKN